MKKNTGNTITTVIIIVLLAAILLAVTNPDRDNHIQAITDNLSGKDTVTNVLNLGMLTVSPPSYSSYVFFSKTEYKNKTASIGLLGYVWVNGKVFK